jgi:hypothetical protein
MRSFPVRRRVARPRVTASRRRAGLAVDRLEDRRLLAITPLAIVPEATWIDADGDTVVVRVTGPITSPSTQGVSVQLTGLATDDADADTITLHGLSAANGVEIVVTPNQAPEQPSPPGAPGDPFATMYTPAYTNVATVKRAVGMTSLGSVRLSAAIVNKIDLTGVAVANDITLDVGQAPLVDRINTQNAEAADSTTYNPVTGLIQLGGIVASKVGSIVIDGAISATTKNPFDTATTNDFRSVIEVEQTIGSIIGLRSNLRAAVHAQSIGTVRVAAITGEITTRDSGQDLAINLPSQFSGFINSAGHLHLGFPLGDGSKITGQIQALGISGNVKEGFRVDRYVDPLLVPGTFLGSLRLTGDPAAPPAAYAGVPGAVGDFPAIDVDGIAGLGLRTDHGDIGDVSANAFAATFVAEADAGSVGFLDASEGEFAGHVRAMGDIAGLRTVLDVTGTLVSEEGDVGPVSVAVGGFAGFIRADDDVGAVRVFAEITGLGGGTPAVAIQAGGSIAGVESVSAGIEALLQAGDSIGPVTATGNILAGLLATRGSIASITSHAGFIESPSIQAGGDVGPISAYGGILDTSIVAARDVGMIAVRAGTVQLVSIRAGNDIAGVTIVDGSLETSSLVAVRNIGRVEAFGSIAAYGISDVSLVAETGAIGEVIGRTHTGNGIEKLKLDAGTSIGLVRGVSYGEYGSLLGFGIVDTNAVAASIGTVLGVASGGTAIKTSTFITRTALDASGNPLRTNAIGSVTGRGWRGGLDTVTVVAHGDIGTISGVADHSGSGISGGSFDSHYGKIGAVTGVGGPGASGHGLDSTRFQATDLDFGGIGRVTATASAGGGNAIFDTKILAGGTGIGPVRATVHGGVDGNGIVGGEIRSYAGPIASVDVIVRSTEGSGIVDGKIQASGDLGPLRVTTLAKMAIDGGEFTSRGNFGAIRAEAQKGGVAISGATFQALGRIADPADPALWNADPLGNFGTVTAIAGGTAAADKAIDGATFEAIGGFGKILATSRGGEAITGSTFTADSDGNDVGSMVAIEAINTGRQRASSAGITDSTFTAAGIGPITARITTIEGGKAINASTFTATTAIYDGFGNFDDTGAIGAITVTSAASEFGGIVESTFAAGAAGRIVAVAVTSASGIGIVDSEFSATRADVDQNLFTGTIGPVTVNTGRAARATVNSAGIDNSSFTALAGIGAVTVDSVGTGISSSTFDADEDFGGIGDVRGDLGALTVRVPGRNANGVIDSTFAGANLGAISVRLADNAFTAGDAVANSTFTARVGSIGNVTIVHARGLSPTTPGSGLAIRDSVFKAVTAIGAVSITGPTQGAEFIVTGSPAALRTTTTPSIASVFIRGAITTGATFRTPTSIGPVTLWALPAGASGRVALFAPQVGDVSVGSSAASANPAIETTATSIASISAGGNLSLTAASLQTVSNVFVGGKLSLPSGLPALRTVSGSFSAGSLAPVSSDVSIGSAGTAGSVIGPIRITAANTSAGTYRFTFAGFSGTPEAIVGGTSIIALPAPGAVANGVRLIRG